MFIVNIYKHTYPCERRRRERERRRRLEKLVEKERKKNREG